MHCTSVHHRLMTHRYHFADDRSDKGGIRPHCYGTAPSWMLDQAPMVMALMSALLNSNKPLPSPGVTAPALWLGCHKGRDVNGRTLIEGE